MGQKGSDLNTRDLILGDAYYGTYFLLASLKAKGVDAVFEQMGARKRAADFKTGKQLGAEDHLVELKKPKKNLTGWNRVNMMKRLKH